MAVIDDIKVASLEAGKNAADFVLQEVLVQQNAEFAKDSVKLVYNNIKSGMQETYNGKILGAKNEGLEEMYQSIISKGSNPDFILDEDGRFVDAGIYAGEDKKRRSAQYVIDESGILSDSETGVASRVNDWSMIKYRGEGENPKLNKALLGASRGKDNAYVQPTASNIISYTDDVGAVSYVHNLKDFIFCKWYGKIPNNYMLTLRRFAFPVEDNIINPVIYSYKDKKPKENKQPAIAQAITWMGPSAGNELKEILKFNAGFKWKQVDAAIQEINVKDRDRGFVGGFLDALPYSSATQGGLRGESAVQRKRRKAHGGQWDPIKQTYPNHVFAPLNIIKSMQVRDSGLTFDQSFTLKFEFSLKGIPGTSPKMALLDVLANMLTLTYNNAPFWGGGIRYTGAAKQQGKPFGDLSKLQSGDYKGFLSSVMKDLSKGLGNIMGDLGKMGDSKILNNVIGGGLMDLFGGPQGGQIAQAFLTGEATGQWHLTVGNPLNPIAVIGNLGCKNTTFEFDGPLGYEDFPSHLIVTVELQPNRPRDKADIESMFNAGKGRLYLPQVEVLNPEAQYNPSAYGNKDFGKGVSREAMMKEAAKYANG